MIKVGSCEEQSSGIYYWIFALAFLKYLSENNEKVGQVLPSHEKWAKKPSNTSLNFSHFQNYEFSEK